MKNIVLIGMPGCGKSTVGPLLGLPFFDTDAEAELIEARSVADIFDAEGEPYFRRLECEIVLRLSKMNGIAIATGGGIVKNPANMEALKHNGFVVFLNRPFELTDTSNADRPLLRDACKWQELYNERLPLYRMYADVEVRNDCGLEECAEKILRSLR